MKAKTKQKIRRIVLWLFLFAAGVVLLFIIGAMYIFSHSRSAFTLPSHAPASFSLPTSEVGYAPSNISEVSTLSSSETVGTTASSGSDALITERKLTQNGYVELAVTRVEDSISSLSLVAQNLGGRVDSVSYFNNDRGENKNAVIVLRVPATNFQQGMDQIKSTALKVVSENITTSDVTEQFVDRQAKLKNLKLEEEQYQNILKKTLQVNDILAVSQELASVRQEIDRAQGEMNYLSRQVDMSVITVSLSSDPEIATGVLWNPQITVEEAIQGLLAGFYGFLKILIFLIIFLIPIFALWVLTTGLILWAGWKFVRRIQKRFSDKHRP